MFGALYQGLPVHHLPDEHVRARRHPRKHQLMAALGYGPFVYVAESPCGTVVKVGRSWNPVMRVHEATGWAKATVRLGVGRMHLARVYDLLDNQQACREEHRCHAFLAPDRIKGEWYRVGPRTRILVARMDRRFGPFCPKSIFREAEHVRRSLFALCSLHVARVTRRVKGGKSQAAAA